MGFKMTIEWEKTDLPEQFRRYQVLNFAEFDARFAAFHEGENTPVRLVVKLEGLAAYTQTWGIKSGVWLVMAVLKMLHDILADYHTNAADLPLLAGEIPDRFKVIINGENEQEIAHRLITAYAEIFNILVRVHSQTKTRIWNRQAAIVHFPQLTLEHLDTDNRDESATET